MGLSWGNSFIRFDNLTKETVKDLKKDIQNIVTDTGTHVKRKARLYTPVDTGLLRSSWKKKSSGSGFKRKVVISNDVFYGVFVEFGTIRMAPRRMLKRAVMSANRYMIVRMGRLKMKMARNFNRGI
jgi:HK97 gp10 family phage protein